LLNDTWLLATDTNGYTFQATITALDTMTINSMVDSVKIINIQAFNGVTPIANPYNVNFTLSKYNGFVQLIPWYSFPYNHVFTLNLPFIPFITTAKYLDSNSVFYKNYGEFGAKYQAGNEWIARIDTNDDGFRSHKIVSDSIISSQLLPSGAIAYSTNRKLLYVLDSILNGTVILDSVIYINQQMIIYDTIYLKPSPLLGDSLIKICQDYFLDPFTENNMAITFSNDCLNRNLMQYSSSDFMSTYVSSITDTCAQVNGSLEPNGFNTNWLEGFGIVYDSNANWFYGKLYKYQILYSNLNGQICGNKVNFAASASQFKLSVSQVNASLANVTWQTLNELNVDHFEIERSYDAVHFENIGKQNSKGDNINENAYSFIDDAYLQSQVFYRIKMVDIDGKIAYSNVAKANFKNSNDISITNTMFTDNIEINHLTNNMNYNIQLFDCIGKVILTQEIKNNSNNNFQINHLGNLANGMYYLTVANKMTHEKLSYKLLK
jgi:hypothetical protein